jgi:hypothetical protein
MKKKLLCCLYTLLFMSEYQVHAQAVRSDSSLVVMASLQRRYAAVVQRESRLYNGPEYVNYVKRYVNGHQFFESDEPRQATIEYDGVTYTGVPLRYDLVRGHLVLRAPLGALNMHLVNEHVTAFTLAGHSFIRLVTSSTGDSSVRTGFYDLLLDGPARVVVARRKEVQERTTQEGPTGEINQKNTIFIYQAGQYYKVSKANTVLSVFPQHKSELRKYIKTKKLKFRPNSRESAIVELVRYQGTLGPN